MQYLFSVGVSVRFVRMNDFNKTYTERYSGNGKPFGHNVYWIEWKDETQENFTTWFASSPTQSTSNIKVTKC